MFKGDRYNTNKAFIFKLIHIWQLPSGINRYIVSKIFSPDTSYYY